MSQRALVIDGAQRTAAKVAAIATLIPVACVVYANFGLRARLLVRGDTAETVRRIAAAQPLFRLSVVLDVVYCVGVVVAVAALYVVLRRVSRHLAVLAALWKFVHAVTAVLTALAFLSILRLAGDATYAQAFEPGSLQALVRLHSSATRDQYYVGLVFWSLSSTVFGWLWLKSRYVPAPLAVFGLASSVWCAFCALAYLIDPAFAHVVDLWWFDSPMAVFDIVLSIWLLLKGLPRSASPDAEREGGPAPAA